MDLLKEKIEYEINWRINELSTIKRMIYSSALPDAKREVLLKYSILSMYAIWEGYVKKILTYYIEEINSLQLTILEINVNLVTYDIDCKHNLSNARKHIDKMRIFTERLRNYFLTEPVALSKSIKGPNINYKTLNKHLASMCLRNLPRKPYKKGLDKLVIIKNAIAHGEENPVTINTDLINEISNVIVDSMYELSIIIIEDFKDECYLS